MVLDVIPVDVVANAALTILPGLRDQKDVRIYHVGTGSRNPVRLGAVFEYVYEYFRDNPLKDREGRPISVKKWKFPSQGAFRRRIRVRYQWPLAAAQWLIRRLPSTHASTRWARKISRTEATLERVLSLSQIYGPYTTLNCLFETGNIEQVYSAMSEDDRERFNTDVSRIDWREYVQDIHIPGLRRHVLKYGDVDAMPNDPVLPKEA